MYPSGSRCSAATLDRTSASVRCWRLRQVRSHGSYREPVRGNVAETGAAAWPAVGKPLWRRNGLAAYCRRYSSPAPRRSEEHTSELQSLAYLVCRLLLEKKKKKTNRSQIKSTL